MYMNAATTHTKELFTPQSNVILALCNANAHHSMLEDIRARQEEDLKQTEISRN